MAKPNVPHRMRVLAVIGAALIYAPFASADTPSSGGQQSMETMKSADKNKDHQVSKEEFMAYQETMFVKMDKNKDGMITTEEWLGRELRKSDGSY